MGPSRAPFLSRIRAGGRVLDVGSGSGRDTLAFLGAELEVDAFDASRAMAASSTGLTGVVTRVGRVEELDARGRYDGVWANASLLHVARVDLGPAMGRLAAALRPGGVAYASFRLSRGERTAPDGRLFLDMDEAAVADLVCGQPSLEVVACWTGTCDPLFHGGRGWVNVLARRRG